jgi:hypothetical protein
LHGGGYSGGYAKGRLKFLFPEIPIPGPAEAMSLVFNLKADSKFSVH